MTEKLTQEKFNTMLIESKLEIKAHKSYKDFWGDTKVELVLVLDGLVISETIITIPD